MQQSRVLLLSVLTQDVPSRSSVNSLRMKSNLEQKHMRGKRVQARTFPSSLKTPKEMFLPNRRISSILSLLLEALFIFGSSVLVSQKIVVGVTMRSS